MSACSRAPAASNTSTSAGTTPRCHSDASASPSPCLTPRENGNAPATGGNVEKGLPPTLPPKGKGKGKAALVPPSASGKGPTAEASDAVPTTSVPKAKGKGQAPPPPGSGKASAGPPGKGAPPAKPPGGKGPGKAPPPMGLAKAKGASAALPRTNGLVNVSWRASAEPKASDLSLSDDKLLNPIVEFLDANVVRNHQCDITPNCGTVFAAAADSATSIAELSS